VRVFIALLVLVTLYLQYVLWFERGGVREVTKLERAVAEQQAEIQSLRERNQALAAEVIDLKQGLEAIEERARSDMGMIKQGEVFFRMTDPPPADDGDGVAAAPAADETP
jgi:cell division protein FtsB